MFSSTCARINGWVNSHEAGDLKRHSTHYHAIVMMATLWQHFQYVRYIKSVLICIHLTILNCIFWPIMVVGFRLMLDRLSSLQWRHNGRDDVSNHQPRHCLLNSLFRRKSKKISKFLVTGLCAGNSSVTGEFLAQMDSNAENVSIRWRHHGVPSHQCWVTVTYLKRSPSSKNASTSNRKPLGSSCVYLMRRD